MRSLIDGSDFGEDLASTIVNVAADSIGNSISRQIAEKERVRVDAAYEKALQVQKEKSAVENGVPLAISELLDQASLNFDPMPLDLGLNLPSLRSSSAGRDRNGIVVNSDADEIVVTADGRPFKVLDTHRGASNLDEWQRWYDNYRQDDPNFDKYSNSAETKAAFANDRALLKKGTVVTNPQSDQTGPIGMGFDYFIGTGDNTRYFGPGSSFSDTFSQGKGAKAFTRFALEKYRSGNYGVGFVLVENFDYKFTAGRVLRTTNLAEHFVGSWQDGNAYIVGDKIHFVVQNTAGTGSLLYGRPLNDMGLPSPPSFERQHKTVQTPIGSFRTPSPLGNIHMTIEWTAPLPKRP